MDLLEGKRTKISGWLSAAAGVLIMIGVEIDPATIMAWLEQWNEVIGTAFGLFGVGVHYFRNKAGK